MKREREKRSDEEKEEEKKETGECVFQCCGILSTVSYYGTERYCLRGVTPQSVNSKLISIQHPEHSAGILPALPLSE